MYIIISINKRINLVKLFLKNSTIFKVESENFKKGKVYTNCPQIQYLILTLFIGTGTGTGKISCKTIKIDKQNKNELLNNV